MLGAEEVASVVLPTDVVCSNTTIRYRLLQNVSKYNVIETFTISCERLNYLTVLKFELCIVFSSNELLSLTSNVVNIPARSGVPHPMFLDLSHVSPSQRHK